MSKGLFLSGLVRGIIDQEMLEGEGEFSFLVSFKTRADEEGHVLWLREQFEAWMDEIKKIPGVVHVRDLKVTARTVSVNIRVYDGIMYVHYGNITNVNPTVAGNVVAAIKKSLAEIVIREHGPKFDYENPLFYAVHEHMYQVTPCCADWEIGTPKLQSLKDDSRQLAHLIDNCGAILKEVRILPGSGKMQIVLRWKHHATEAERETLKKVIEAYFKGLGFSLMSWQCMPKED